ncbi:subtilisin-like protein [Roridomyces roridus]|uniref:tripeptidyl-peptidase II n=1 Tax=Roridomyces roridus TaxID=1738132 RepID=A0AAD7BMG2_9AGAR|nr:subtilisin-like protein [Roridomyces roridus]
MIGTTLLSGALLISLVTASPINRPCLFESRRTAPKGFTHVGAAPESQSFKLRIALASNNVSGLETTLLDISNPSSPNYGNHLTKDEVNTFLAPTDEAVTAVQRWLTKNNITAAVSGSAGDWLSANVTVAQANSLLSANYQTFQHDASGKTYARTLAHSVPATVSPFIAAIHPASSFNNPVSSRPVLSVLGGKTVDARAIPRSCATSVTPACLQALYGIPTTPATQASNSIVIPGFIEQFAQKADLQSFLQSFRTDIDPATTFATQTLDGGKNTQGARFAGIEALDIQYTVGVATNVPITFVTVGENTQDGDLGGFLDIVNAVAAEDAVPQVMSTSYGENESDLSIGLATKLCNAYMALGARGTSVLFASGDGGVEGGQAQQCSVFQVAFPAGCPYLTAVGSVHGVAPEIASDFSSGGFSNVFGTPDYQATAVAGYLKTLGNTNKGLFNTSGRAYPDVSAQGENVQIVSGGSTGGVDGTSASSPIFASVIGLINDELIAGGKSPLGFLNPWLYANAAAFNDVVDGSNPGCGTDGFPALAGWDPVTGLGTPNFAAMRTAAGF